jgi:hypothetical protein
MLGALKKLEIPEDYVSLADWGVFLADLTKEIRVLLERNRT